ncbi:MAG TPA: SH3-like domain-containing protein [Nevskiaceae bacterium]|nr:SH3-like domain-containing protein [Nevskiaceae bacterium]
MPVLRAGMVDRAVAAGHSARVTVDALHRFKVGDAVRARNLHPLRHTRLPRYVRGHRGTITRDCGVFVLPDTHAYGLGACPERVYCVRFEATELWGAQAHAGDAVYVTLWDRYLDDA